MSLKAGKVNPLNVLGVRRTSFPAQHFHYISIPKYTPTLHRTISDWIYNNLNGRFYIGQAVDLVDNTIVFVTKIGFEQEKEVSYFKLACPHIS
jgi:hypothetical protein